MGIPQEQGADINLLKIQNILEAYSFIKKINQQQSELKSSESTLDAIDKLLNIRDDNVLLKILSEMEFPDLLKLFQAPKAYEVLYYINFALARQSKDEEAVINAYQHAASYSQFYQFNPGAFVWRRIAENLSIDDLVKLIRMRIDEAKTLPIEEQPDNTLADEELLLLHSLIFETPTVTEDNCKRIYFARVALAKSIGHKYLNQAAEIFGQMYCANQLTEWNQELRDKTAVEICAMVRKMKDSAASQAGCDGYQLTK